MDGGGIFQDRRKKERYSPGDGFLPAPLGEALHIYHRCPAAYRKQSHGNALRPVAVGSKNYLFAGSHEAAHRAAMVYSLFATCKLHDINPYHWLKDVLERMHLYTTGNIEELLPQNWKKQHEWELGLSLGYVTLLTKRSSLTPRP